VTFRRRHLGAGRLGPVLRARHVIIVNLHIVEDKIVIINKLANVTYYFC